MKGAPTQERPAEDTEQAAVCKPRGWTPGEAHLRHLVTLMADLQPPEPQDKERLFYQPPAGGTLFRLPESPTPSSTAVWLGRDHILECQVSILGKGVTHTAPHGRHMFTSQSPLGGRRSSEFSSSLPSRRLETHNVEHTPATAWGLGPVQAGPPDFGCASAHRPPFLKRTCRSHLSGILFP